MNTDGKATAREQRVGWAVGAICLAAGGVALALALNAARSGEAALIAAASQGGAHYYVAGDQVAQAARAAETAQLATMVAAVALMVFAIYQGVVRKHAFVLPLSLVACLLASTAFLSGYLNKHQGAVVGVERMLAQVDHAQIDRLSYSLASRLAAPMLADPFADGPDGRRYSVFGSQFVASGSDGVAFEVPFGRACRIALEALVRVESLTQRRVVAHINGSAVVLNPSPPDHERAHVPRDHASCEAMTPGTWATLSVSLATGNRA